MEYVVSVASLLTAAVSTWMAVMYFVLRHPGYQWRAAIAAGICCGALTLVAGRPWRPIRIPVALWGGVLAIFGAAALLGGSQEDGWALIAAIVFVTEGLLAVWASAALIRQP